MPQVRFCLSAEHPAHLADVEVTVPAGTRLLDAAAQAGAMVPTQCGGVLACLACRVRIRAGAVAPAGAKERARLDEIGAAGDERFACHARAQGDVVVEILPPGIGEPP